MYREKLIVAQYCESVLVEIMHRYGPTHCTTINELEQFLKKCGGVIWFRVGTSADTQLLVTTQHRLKRGKYLIKLSTVFKLVFYEHILIKNLFLRK